MTKALYVCCILIGITIGLIVGIISPKQYEPIITLNLVPTSAKALNQTSISSIVSSTSEEGKETILNLANGMNLIYNGTDIKSGDVLDLNIMIYQPVCSINILNSTFENDTSVMIQTLKDPRCQDGYKAIQILDWHKLNQK